MKIIHLLFVAMILASFVFIGCEATPVVTPTSQQEFTDAGWQAWAERQYTNAHEMFQNAYKIDATYADAYNGDAWTYFREEDLQAAFNKFMQAQYMDNALLDSFAGNSAVLLYMGYFNDSALYGTYVSDNAGDNYTFARDVAVTSFDVYMVLALDYFGLADSVNCCVQINNMRRIIGEPTNFGSGDWNAIATEIDRLSDLDPS
jgi:tetratricopeptide (TPR) repeat protein